MERPIKTCLLLFVFLSTMISYGQDGSISGIVADIDGQPIAFANVILMKAQDSTLVQGISTNEKGFFLFDRISEDSYMLKFSFIGFTDIYKVVFVNQSIQLGTLVLEEASQELDEISILAKRPTLRKEADRLVFNVENTALIEGNMFQVLKNTPGILVINNKIQVKNSTPTVYINDKKVHLSGNDLAQLLEGSSANSIKSIEVITNPSSKYDAESGSVIKIVMSKNLITGYSGDVFTNYTQGVYPRYEVGMSNFFKNKTIDFFANYTYSDSKTNRYESKEINYLDANNTIDQTFNSITNRTTWSKMHNINFNFDYTIDDNNGLSLSSNALWMPYFKYDIKDNTDVFDANQDLDFYYDATNQSNDDKYNVGFNVDYIHKFKKEGEKFVFNAHYTTYNYMRDQNVFSNYYENDNTLLATTAFRTDNNQDTEILTAKVDYVVPFNDASVLETGVKISTIKTQSDITRFNIVNNQETIDVNNTDAFDYDEDIFAAYVNYSKDWEKLNLIVGLRAEQTKVNGQSNTNNIANFQDYLEWFPTANLHYTFSDNFSLYTNYKRSIGRPDYQSLNPFQFFLNDYTIVAGNPNLQPVFVNHTLIGTSFYKSIFTIEAYYKKSDNSIFELPRQDNTNNILTYTPFNIDKTREYGFDFLVYFDMTKHWSVYFVTSFYNTKDEDVFDGLPVSKSQWSNYTQTNHSFTLLKDRSLSANLNIVYAAKNTQSFTQSEALLFSELSVSKSILKKKGTLSLAVSDLFNTQNFNTKIRYLNQNNTSFVDQDTRYIKLGFRYKFGNTNLETNQRSKSQQETERLEKIGN